MYSSYYTVSQKNDTALTRYNFNLRHPILVFFGRNVALTIHCKKCPETILPDGGL